MRIYQLLFITAIFFCTCSNLHAQEKGWIKAGNLKVYYEKSGKGEAMVFLHAGYMDHRMWDQQVAFFKKDHTVITIDQPRHGLTSGTDSIIPIADVVRICLDSLHIAKATMIGLSLGGVSIADFAIAYPSRTKALVFVCAGLSGSDKVVEADSISMQVFNRSEQANKTESIKKVAEAFTINWCLGPFREPAQVDSNIRNYVYTQVVTTLEKHLPESWPAFKQNPQAAFEIDKIKVKTLIITADKDVPYIETIAGYLHQHISNSRTYHFKGSAHMVNMELPGEFNRVVGAFLRGG